LVIADDQMAVSEKEDEGLDTNPGVSLESFSIEGLFGYLNHTITFPQMSPQASEPEILIVEGQNGTGKTTIMRMIAGIVEGLDFDPFRKVPFARAQLKLSTGDVLGVEFEADNPDFSLVATFRNHRVPLVRDRDHGSYTPSQQAAISAYRHEALPLLRGIDFELLTIERSLEVEAKSSGDLIMDPRTGDLRPRVRTKSLASRVRDFLREAQVNYRRFFQAEELELLPRILKQFSQPKLDYEPDSLLKRVNAIRDKNQLNARFGLQTDDEELETLASLLGNIEYRDEQHALALLASYVEVHENRSQARDLIALRLSLFETIMDDFFVGKKIRIAPRTGFEIISQSGRLSEKDLSSGEFHFLYMMVAALLCERTGTIIAIDEPELSLHVSWQRRLIGALSKCASGAAPLFFLSTHSTAISSAHRFAVQTLSTIE